MSQSPTRLLPVGTRLHGEGHYLVDRREYDAREDQIYAIVAKFDEAMRQRHEHLETLSAQSREIQLLKQRWERAREIVGKLFDI